MREMTDLDFATTQELIDEITRRPGFAGIVIYSPQNASRSAIDDFVLATTFEIEDTRHVLFHVSGLLIQSDTF